MNSRDKQKKQLWYVRRGSEMQGPYPAGLITRYILLGRILQSDEVSCGDNNWIKVADVPELVPEVMQTSMDDPVSRQRLMAAKRWADERSKEDRRQFMKTISADRRTEDRRVSTVDAVQPRENAEDLIKEQVEVKEKDRQIGKIIVISVVAAVVVAMYLLKPRPPDTTIDCNALPHAGVNWSNCHKEGASLGGKNLIGAILNNMDLSNADLHASQLTKADLSYSNLAMTNMRDADLREANLVGVNLRQSDLANANLKDADLSYANLTDANFRGSLIEGAKLENAIWIDGSTCGPGSVGQCRQ